MRKLTALITLGLALAFFGCAPMAKKEAAAPEKSLLKCSTCGLEFTDPEGLKLHEKKTDHNH